MLSRVAAKNLPLLLALIAFSSEAQPVDPQTILNNLRLHVASTVEHAPRYTCMESLERSWYENRKPVRPGCDTDRSPGMVEHNLVRSDRLRLDVAVVSGQESFSWHGQRAFQTDEVDKLVTAGPVNSGTYFSFLSSIFLEGIARIDYRGMRNAEGKRLALFGYAVPIANQTRAKSGTDVIGYHGEFTVDIATGGLDLLRISTDDMPMSAMVCGFSLQVRYDRVSAAGIEFQLPSSVVMEVLDVNHTHTKTVTEYSQCHEFVGESVLYFGTGPVNKSSARGQPAEHLPAGLNIQIKITTAIDPRSAWAGDPIDGKLISGILDDRGKVLIPTGTLVHGRLLRLETWVKPSCFYTVALQFRSMSFAGKEYELRLRSLAPPAAAWESSPLRRRIYLNSPPISGDPAACRFRLSDRQSTLRNVLTYWTTN